MLEAEEIVLLEAEEIVLLESGRVVLLASEVVLLEPGRVGLLETEETVLLEAEEIVLLADERLELDEISEVILEVYTMLEELCDKEVEVDGTDVEVLVTVTGALEVVYVGTGQL